MKNTLFALVAIIGLCGSAHAQVAVKAQTEYQIVPNKMSCSSTTLSTTATDVTGNTGTLSFTSPGVYEIDVMTLSASATAYFSDNSAVAASGALIGAPVYPVVTAASAAVQPGFVQFVINPTQKFYGVSGTAGQSVMICKKR